MDSKDRALGMDVPITRRDFLDGTARVIGGLVAGTVVGDLGAANIATSATTATPSAASVADAVHYPPLRQGMRGFDNAAMTAGHAVRDGTLSGPPRDTGEHYDLIVVGAGMAGLSAAYFYRQQMPGAKILVLDCCDDFGGHARRVEFNVDGRQLMVCGGTQELWNVNTFSPESLRMLQDIGIDRARYAQYAKAEVDPLDPMGLGMFFASEVFGEDRLVTQRPAPGGATAEQMRAWYDRTPMSENLKAGLLKIAFDQTDYLAGLSVQEKIARLRKISYTDYLSQIAGIHPEAVAYVLRGGSGDTDNTAAGPDTYSAWNAWRRGRRGFAGLGLPRANQLSNLTADVGEMIQFPDGNAGVARLLIRAMIPDALPGSTAEDSIRAPLHYERLDRPDHAVRIRLSSTVVRVKHVGDPVSSSGVEAVYVRDGILQRVSANAAVMACFNAMVPHLVPDLPEAQQAALRLAVRKPLVRAYVALRNYRAFAKLGTYEVECPGMFFRYFRPWIMPEWGGAYRNARTPDEPVIVYMDMARDRLELHGTDLPPRERWRAARAQLQAIDFETMERHIRDQLSRVLGPGGFDARRDIAGITVCRWAHGYAGGANELYDPDWSQRTDAPWVVGRQRFGRIAISNSDAAATSLTNAAFAQSHRAVSELVNDVVRPIYDFRFSEQDRSAEPETLG